jgi:starch synthase
MKICFVASEAVPFAKTGGLADVSGSLPKALSKLGNDVKVFIPNYGNIEHFKYGITPIGTLRNIPVYIGDKIVTFNVYDGKLSNSNLPIYFVDCPHYFHRPSIYTNDPDENERFILFSRAVLETLQRMQWSPNIIHCNDWQTALIPVYLKNNYAWDRLFHRTSCLLSIHNIGYQGLFPKDTVWKAGLSYDQFYPGGPYEFHGAFSFLKAGILYSEQLSTVSETYGYEIQTPEYGAKLDGLLRDRRHDFHGILNGVDYDVWNPETDKLIPLHYNINNLEGKKENKKELLKKAGLPFNENTPVIGVVSRLTAQKGFDLLPSIIYGLMELNLQMVILGTGEHQYEELMRAVVRAFPHKMSAAIEFNNQIAHLIEAGADMFLMPSRYEPCGLNQIYSLKYGTVPIVRKTGGLADTVRDYHEYEYHYGGGGNGFSFEDYSPRALYETIVRAISMFHNKNVWFKIIQNGMNLDFSWEVSARKYIDLYNKMMAMKG